MPTVRKNDKASPLEIPKLKLHKLGADPEFVYYSRSRDKIISAIHFCGGGSAMSSKIGTDGHYTTAELRPSPQKDVRMLLYDLAACLSTVGDAIDAVNARSDMDIVAVAQPIFMSEPMGGHIHLSYYGSEPIDLEFLFHFIDRVVNPYKKILFPNQGGRSENGYTYREQPFGRHSLQHTHPYRGRIEYRRPNTWLAHPRLAYVFLGLVKLVALNYGTSVTDVQAWRKTPDLADLWTAIEVSKAKVAEYPTPLTIDFEAWRKLLA